VSTKKQRRAVILTRTAAQSDRLAKHLTDDGFEVIVSPLLSVEFLPPPSPRFFDGVQAVLLTSANAVGALENAPRSTLCLTVGQRTAEAAQDAGMANVQSADGDAKALAQLALSIVEKTLGAVVHLCGEHVTNSPLPPLKEAGFTVATHVAYRVDYGGTLNEAALAAITAPPGAVFPVFSAKSAEALALALSSHGLQEYEIFIAGLSAATLEPLAVLGNAVRAVAERPIEADLYHTITELAQIAPRSE